LENNTCQQCHGPMKSEWVVSNDNATGAEQAFLVTWCPTCVQQEHHRIINRLAELIGQEVCVAITTEQWEATDGTHGYPAVREEKRGVLEEVNSGLYSLTIRGEGTIEFHTDLKTYSGNVLVGRRLKEITTVQFGDEVVFSK